MHSNDSSPRLILAAHVRACECDGKTILLDLRRNRYFGIDQSTSRSLADVVLDWPRLANFEVQPLTPEVSRKVTISLTAQGILTDLSTASGPGLSIADPSTTVTLSADLADRAINARCVLRFFMSVSAAAWWMKWRSMYDMACSIEALRKKHCNSASDSLETMEPSIACYQSLRPFAFTARDQCLLDSLVLMILLTREGLLPRLVVGIKTTPFGAHSWVQSGDTVLNDQHEYVRQFRPILVV